MQLLEENVEAMPHCDRGDFLLDAVGRELGHAVMSSEGTYQCPGKLWQAYEAYRMIDMNVRS